MAGGTKGSLPSFPIGEIIESTSAAYTNYQALLGTEVEGERGKRYRLVQAAAADTTTGRAKVYEWAVAASHTVQLATASTDTPCGVGLADQESITTIGDLFWLQIAGRATVTDSGSGLSVGDCVVPAATGDVAVQAATSLVEFNTTVGVVLTAISADAQGTVQLRGGL